MIQNIMDNTKMDLATLEEFIETRDPNLPIPEHVTVYMEQLDKIHGWFYQGNSPSKIKKKLRAHYPYLGDTVCRNRINDAVTHFYLDKEANKKAWANIHAEKQWQLAEATLLSATEARDYKLASDIFEKAYKMKMEAMPDDSKIPEELLAKKVAIYSLKGKDVGIPEINRQQLAREIDQLRIEESAKLKLKQDLGEAPRQIFNYEERHEQEKD